MLRNIIYDITVRNNPFPTPPNRGQKWAMKMHRTLVGTDSHWYTHVVVL